MIENIATGRKGGIMTRAPDTSQKAKFSVVNRLTLPDTSGAMMRIAPAYGHTPLTGIPVWKCQKPRPRAVVTVGEGDR